MEKSRYLLYSLFILAVLLRLFYAFSTAPVILLDETQYIIEAKHVLYGIYDPLQVHHNQGLRYIFIWLIAGEIFLFGVKKYFLASILFLFSILTGILIYAVTKKLYEERTALIALFLFAIFPLNIKYSTIIEPDVIVSTIITAGIALFLFCQEGELGYVVPEKRWSYLFIGALFGLSIFIKFFSALGLIIILFLSFQKKTYRPFFFILIGFLVAVSPLIAYQYLETGDPLHHITVDREVNKAYLEKRGAPESSFLPYLFSPFSKTQTCVGCVLETSLFTIYPYLFLISIGIGIFFRQKKEYFLFFWLLLGYGILEFHHEIFPIQRYLLLIEVPLIVLAAKALSPLKNKILACAFAGIYILSLFQLGADALFIPTKMYHGERYTTAESFIALFLKDYPEKDIYVSQFPIVPYLTHYLGYTKNSSLPLGYRGPATTSIYDLHFIRNSSDIKNAYVFLDHTYLMNDTIEYSDYYKEMNGSLAYLTEEALPTGWILLFNLTDSAGILRYSLFEAE